MSYPTLQEDRPSDRELVVVHLVVEFGDDVVDRPVDSVIGSSVKRFQKRFGYAGARVDFGGDSEAGRD